MVFVKVPVSFDMAGKIVWFKHYLYNICVNTLCTKTSILQTLYKRDPEEFKIIFLNVQPFSSNLCDYTPVNSVCLGGGGGGGCILFLRCQSVHPSVRYVLVFASYFAK